tara:strand:- start:91 stop:417 length:327 start_codon:yes stop_codon:yes gene_type:complete
MNQQVQLSKGPTNLEMIAFASRHATQLGWELCAITPITDETGYAICKRPPPYSVVNDYSTHLVHMITDKNGRVHLNFISGCYDMKYSDALRNYLSRVSSEIKYLSREV